MNLDVSSGSKQRSIAGHLCFIPNPLPPELVVPPTTLSKLGEVMHLLGQVKSYHRLLPSVEVLIYGSLRREAIASSTIEGTVASADELVLFEVQGFAERSSVGEVANYAAALRHGEKLIEEKPISLNVILELHSILLNGVRGRGAVGRLKSGQNHIGSRRGEPIELASFIPPPPELTLDLMSDLERYINLSPNEPPLIQVALTHYQFETIHPFGDGNGRVGRLLIILQMIQLGILNAPLVYPSVYIERTKDRYINALQGVRDKGDWITWIDYFLEVLEMQSKETLVVAETLLELRKKVREEISDGRRIVAVESALDAFFEMPVLTVPDLAKRMSVVYNTAKSAVDTLATNGVVEKLGFQARNQVYICRPLFDLLLHGIIPKVT